MDFLKEKKYASLIIGKQCSLTHQQWMRCIQYFREIYEGVLFFFFLSDLFLKHLQIYSLYYSLIYSLIIYFSNKYADICRPFKLII